MTVKEAQNLWITIKHQDHEYVNVVLSLLYHF